MFTYTYQTRYGDYKDFDTLRPGAVLDIVQDVSINDSRRCGYGIHKLFEMKLAWLMKGINVRFLKPVRTILPLEVSTAVKAFRGATSERGCILHQNGEVVAKTVANWFIFDIEKERIGKIPEEMYSAYENYDFEDEFFTYKKPPLYEAEAKYTVKVSNKDIDTNKHLNNQKGAEMLMDALPFDFSFTDIKLLYKKPAYLGDMLFVCVKETERGYYVHLQTQEKEICVAGTFESE